MRLHALLILAVAACGRPTRSVQIEVADLVLNGERYGVEANNAKVGHLQVAPPTFEPDVMSGARELPAWLMLPGGSLEFTVPTNLGDSLELHGGFAFDSAECYRRPPDYHETLEARVERLSEDGEEVLFSANLQAVGRAPSGHGWYEIKNSTGAPLRVNAGDRLRIRTRNKLGRRGLPKSGVAGLSLRVRREFETQSATPENPNIVFVLMDTLSAAHTSTFGNPNVSTPELDKLAKRGTAFDEARSAASWTWPATASLLTGLDPAEHGVTKPGSAWLATDIKTLAERLQAADMATAAFTGNRLISADFHFDQGFETFLSPNRNKFIDGVELMPPALEWLEENADERFFLYLHLVDPHRPYGPLPESLEALPGTAPPNLPKLSLKDHVVDLYAESCLIPNRFERPLLTSMLSKRNLEWMDRSYDQAIHTGDIWLGRLVAKLKALGLDDRTVIVFTSDHGEESYEHGDINHGQSLFPELVHVPLVIAGPGVAEGLRVEEKVSTAGLYEYLARLGEVGTTATPKAPDLGANTWQSSPSDAPSAAPSLAGTPQEAGSLFYATSRGQWNGEHSQTLLGIEDERWALHLCVEAHEVRLFDLSTDPQQHHDVAASNPEVVARMRGLLIEHERAAEGRRADTGMLGAGDGAIEALKDIGYL